MCANGIQCRKYTNINANDPEQEVFYSFKAVI